MPQANQRNPLYNAQIVAGSLLLPESRQVARLLLEKADARTWQHAIELKNVLQKRSPASAKRQAKLIQNRLEPMHPELWRFIVDGPTDLATQSLLAAAIKHSRLLGDFMIRVVRENWRTFNDKIGIRDWEIFFELCSQIDPQVAQWTDSTRSKLKQVIFRILAEARYLESTKSGKLLPVSVLPPIKQYLISNSDNEVLRCMEVTQ